MDQFNSGAEEGTEAGVLARVREKASAQLAPRRDPGTDGLNTVAGARETPSGLRDQDHDYLAGYVDKAADHLERFSIRTKERDIGDLVNDVQNFARRRPMVFVGAAFAVGFFGSRFLRNVTPSGNVPASTARVTERTGHEWTENLR